METSLHRELKLLYAGRQARNEVALDGYRIDAIARGRLFEIQHGAWGRSATRSARCSVAPRYRRQADHRRQGARQEGRQGRRGPLSPREPQAGQILDLFDELVHFTNVFPHAGLTLEVLLVRWKNRAIRATAGGGDGGPNDHEVEDQRLVAIHGQHRFRTAADLARLVRDARCPRRSTRATWPSRLASVAGRAQRIVYCLHRMGAMRSGGQGRQRPAVCVHKTLDGHIIGW